MIELSKDDLLFIFGASGPADKVVVRDMLQAGAIGAGSSAILAAATLNPVTASVIVVGAGMRMTGSILQTSMNQLPVNVPMPQVPMNPSWVGNPPPTPHFLPGNY